MAPHAGHQYSAAPRRGAHHGMPHAAPRRPAKGYQSSHAGHQKRGRWPKKFVPQAIRHRVPKAKSYCGLLLLAIMLLVAGVGLCVWVIVGSRNSDGFYIAQVRSNRTDVSISFRLGYLGSCVQATGRQVNASACIARDSYHDDKKDSFALQYLEALGLGSQQVSMNPSLSTSPLGVTTVPQASKDAVRNQLLALAPVMIDMQNGVFPGIPSIIFLSIFGLTSIVLLVMTATSFKSKAVKVGLIITVFLNGYSQTLGWMIAYATRLVCEALLLQTQEVSKSNSGRNEAVLIIGSSTDGLGDNEVFFVSEGEKLQIVQWVIMGLTCLVQILIALLFVKRRAATKAKSGARNNSHV